MAEILKIKQNGTWVGVPAIKGEKGDKGDSGEGVPSGGTTGQALCKRTNTDYDVTWSNVDALPSQSGQSGKFLTTNGTAASWADTPKVTVNGVVKGDGTGNLSAAVKADITALGIPAQDTVTTVTPSGSGNIVTDITASSGQLTVTKGSTLPTKVSDLTNDSGYITGINSSMVTTALGYTPYNSTNPSGYITLAQVPTEIFVVTYGVVGGMYEAIARAIEAGKIVFCKCPDNDAYLIYQYTLSGQHEFAGISNGNMVNATVNTLDVWSTASTSIPFIADAVTTTGATWSSTKINNTITGYHDSTKYDATNPSGYISQAVDDSSTTSTTLGWSASKLNTTIGNIESLLAAI